MAMSLGAGVKYFKLRVDDVTSEVLNDIKEATKWDLDPEIIRRLQSGANGKSVIDLTVFTNCGNILDASRKQHPGHLLSSQGGVVAILGKAAAGKSHLMRHMFVADKKAGRRPVWILHDEQFESVLATEGIMDADMAPAFCIEDAVDRLMLQLLLTPAYSTDTPRPSVYWDSVRGLLYDTKGTAAGRGGMNNTLVIQLTQLSNIALARGVTVVTSLNPMTEDTDLDFIYNRLVASTQVAVFVEDRKKGRVHLREGRIDKSLNNVYDTIVEEGVIGTVEKDVNAEAPDVVTTSSEQSPDYIKAVLPREVRELGRTIHRVSYGARSVKKK
jgi:hypothetical protein